MRKKRTIAHKSRNQQNAMKQEGNNKMPNQDGAICWLIGHFGFEQLDKI